MTLIENTLDGARDDSLVSVGKYAELEGSQTPTSPTSSSATTPRMSNSNDESAISNKDSTLPASTRQPALDTIDPSGSKAATPPRPTIESTGRPGMEKVSPSEGSQQSPRSIKKNVAPPIPGTISGPSPSQANSGRPRRHRRIQSDNVPRDGPVARQQAQPPYYYPPSPGAQRPQAPQDGSYSPHMNRYAGGGQPPPMQRDHMASGPPRGRTWSTQGPSPERSQYAMPSPHQPHPHGMSPRSGSERLPLVKQKSDRSQKGRHRKTMSSSAAIPGPAGYGAFWGGEDGDSARHPTGGYPSPSFSPRGELMSLTQSFRDPGEMSPRQTSPRNQSPRNQYVKRVSVPDIRVSWSPGTPLNQPSPYQVGVGGEPVYLNQQVGVGGEPVYLTHKRTKSESSRKMHLRQHSAQLFMEEVKGVEQPASCRDIIFLLLFVFHLMFMVYLGQIYGKDALRYRAPTDEDDAVSIYYENYIYLAGLSGAFAIVLSALLLAVMASFARHFVQVALIFVITLSFIWGTLGIGLSPKNVVPITGIIALALSVAYTFIVWDRIPFAAANLLTALNGVHAFPSTVGVAFIFQALALGWSIYYAIVIAGIYDAVKEGKLDFSYRGTVLMYILLGVSYYWTFQVFANAVQAATAGVIGCWWNAPEGEAVVRRPAFKTIFYSMGSICFGSLFVGPVRLIRLVSGMFRPHPEDASLMCIYECLFCIQTCITSCVDSLADRFNPWAFMFIGLYGYGFVDAGLRATEVFDRRGWEMIVSDDLVPNILIITSLVIGGVTGCFAHLIEEMSVLPVLSLNEPGLVSFWVGSCVGLVLTSVLFSVISGAMNTVLVCFATTPMDFESNHPELSHEMRAAWREVWPGALDVIDRQEAVAAAAGGYHPEDGRPLLV